MTPFPAGGVLNDVVGVQVEDIDFAEEVVIEDEIAAEGSRGGIAQVLADEAGFEFSPFGTSKIGVDAMKAGDHAKKKKQQRQQKPDFLKMFEERTDAYDRLKEALKEAFGGDSPKAFIFVDELDRCRPDYAISYLETIKHVFDIQGLVFVLSIDYEHLQSSARSLFGQELAFPEYLRKFVQRTSSLFSP